MLPTAAKQTGIATSHLLVIAGHGDSPKCTATKHACTCPAAVPSTTHPGTLLLYTADNDAESTTQLVTAVSRTRCTPFYNIVQAIECVQHTCSKQIPKVRVGHPQQHQKRVFVQRINNQEHDCRPHPLANVSKSPFVAFEVGPTTYYVYCYYTRSNWSSATFSNHHCQ